MVNYAVYCIISYATLAILSDEIYSPGTGMYKEGRKSKYDHYRHLQVCVCECYMYV